MDEHGAKYFCDIAMQELNNCVNRIDYVNISNIADFIIAREQRGGRVHTTGIGKPSYVAGYIASLLSSTGTPSYHLNASETIHGSSGQVKEEDVVIAISNSGMTKELKETVTTLLNNKVTVIGVSGNESSWLAKACQYHILARVNHEGDILNKPPRASILVEMISLQVLSVMLQDKKHLSIADYYQWHPGGSLGESIKKALR